MDKDGCLDYGEFVAISVHLRKMGNDDHLRKAFEFFDRNQNGYIEIEELRDTLADEVDTNNEEVINAIIHDVDTDKVSIYIIYVYLYSIVFFHFFLTFTSLVQISFHFKIIFTSSFLLFLTYKIINMFHFSPTP